MWDLNAACDDERPCGRCVSLGMAEQCHDAECKKRGRPKKPKRTRPSPIINRNYLLSLLYPAIRTKCAMSDLKLKLQYSCTVYHIWSCKPSSFCSCRATFFGKIAITSSFIRKRFKYSLWNENAYYYEHKHKFE